MAGPCMCFTQASTKKKNHIQTGADVLYVTYRNVINCTDERILYVHYIYFTNAL